MVGDFRICKRCYGEGYYNVPEPSGKNGKRTLGSVIKIECGKCFGSGHSRK